MNFEQAWGYLQIIGFKKLDWDYDRVSGKGVRSRKHQVRKPRENVESLFSDKHIFKPRPNWKIEGNNGWPCWENYHEPIKPRRDKTIPIKAPKICVRCGSTENLEREHIVPLHAGGKDESENLRWMCKKCHDFRHVEDKLLETISHYSEDSWRLKMWQYRLEALRRLNPPGEKQFHSYWEDPKTHWVYWSESEEKKKIDGSQLTLTELAEK